MERRAHPSKIQLEILLKFLEHQPSLAKGFSKHTAAREHAHIEWSKLALKLNSVSGGCVKSPKRWMKDPTSSSSGSIRIFTPSHSIAPVSLIEPNTIPNISPEIQETPTIAENIDDSIVYSLINSDVETSKYPEQPQSSSDVSIPSRVRRRFRLQPSPPSQHRNYLNSITEKLLRIEEQRLDLDKKLLDLLNQQSINNNLLIQTVNHGQQAISESQKAMAEALTAIAIAINK
ncbi:uncharacterized protein LOC125053055 isoform X3 [Pieris napi]|uniref:uncharacterized protein LOC125053055 isoform X3 n=1 Tax=Pieris napi TaxID=78633 RepID=UPI001FB86193|nr:uncharacterized protein LOC125053055 isoform X3 [Pieris napi]